MSSTLHASTEVASIEDKRPESEKTTPQEGAGNPDLSLELPGNISNNTPMDWSKPAVSRGFGLEAKSEFENAWIGRYKSGQVSYFFGEYEKAFTSWLPLANENYAEAQASIGWLYQAGLGTSKDIKKAIHFYSLAAKQHHATAQNNLGVLFEQGLGVELDLEVAREWYKKSAEQGYRFAEFNYANFLAEGMGGLKDIEQAMALYQKAADQAVEAAKGKLIELTSKSQSD